MDSSIETRMQLLYHYTHHLIGQRRRGLIVLERAKVLFLAHHLYKYLNQKKPIPKHISILTGAMWLDELIYNPNPVAFHDNLGMSVPAFMKLKDLLEEHRVLYDSKHVTATKKLGILLYMLITGLSNQKLQERFQRSASTISLTINQLVKDITGNQCLIKQYISLPPANADTPEEIKSNSKFSPYFDDCVGAIDGSHIPVFVDDQKRFINRKGYPSQNVLAVCNFNMEFTYVMPGWEGSAHDGRLWDVARTKTLKIPEGKWLLGDAGFPLTDTCLVPYRATKYHLKDWDVLGGKKPQTHQELFNLRHASARNVIERIFGVIKSRFEVINSGCHYDITIQVKVIIVMTFLHNFIRVTDPSEPVNLANTATMVDTDSQQPDTAEYGLLHQPGVTRAESTRAAKKRDEIAIHMWTDYQRILRHRQRHGQGDVFTTSLVV
ncbi:hypothetical protein Pst134EA_033167 [Puccinia striiformis f. sp. tritici]|uniref:Uncharacterized protein n=1 Tax=Puccinia striiformis f. sp. tritici PST-78 TaxID=1165861 RepID=A0A0L0UQQ3_9BASI|nr:hypothetical protein Pst134EA_033167 [Puccinia striiformis f. sp. tritici]KAH9448622.1 hypothetical protein Pst134EA_033167 [Puccinia striiformis f. sp. tritici]KNE89246.1 hypothetical protein PSTG_17295 [Puccinia striiformis f. sp. tritici PST-78]